MNENKKMWSMIFFSFFIICLSLFFQSSIAFDICFSLILLCQSNQNTIHLLSGIRCVIVYSHFHTITVLFPMKYTVFCTIYISFAIKIFDFGEFLIEIQGFKQCMVDNWS